MDGTIQLVPHPSPDVRWQIGKSGVGLLSAMDTFHKTFDLSAGGMSGRATVFSTSSNSVSGISPCLEYESGKSMVRAILHWMNLPNYTGNMVVQYKGDDGSTTLTAGRLSVEVEGWSITLDGRPDNSSLFKDDVGLARYVLTHVMELRRTDGTQFQAADAKRMIETLRLSLSFAAGRWVAPALSVGLDGTNEEVWRLWVSPICAPYETIGSPIISPRVFADVQQFLKFSVSRLHEGNAGDTTRFQMQLATQTSNLGFVENRIFSAFPAIENLSWETLVLSGLVPKAEYKNTTVWPTSRRLREVLNIAQIPVDLDPARLPNLHQLAVEKGFDGPDAVAWVRNRLIHPEDPYTRLYTRGSLVEEAWQLSREYICLLVLHAIKYTGGYLGALPPLGWVGNPAPVPWATP